MTEVLKTPAPAEVLTSENLTVLENQLIELETAIDKAERGSQAKKDAVAAYFRHEKLIDAEKVNIRKGIADNKKQEDLNKRLAFIDSFEAAVVAKNAKGAGQEATDAYLAAKDVLKNELSARYSSSTPAKAKVEGEGTKGATTADIKAKLIEFMTSGQNATEAVKSVVALGFSRGTTGAVRTEMVKTGEIKDNKLA